MDITIAFRSTPLLDEQEAYQLLSTSDTWYVIAGTMVPVRHQFRVPMTSKELAPRLTAVMRTTEGARRLRDPEIAPMLSDVDSITAVIGFAFADGATLLLIPS